eukprot:s6204_g1.t1
MSRFSPVTVSRILPALCISRKTRVQNNPLLKLGRNEHAELMRQIFHEACPFKTVCRVAFFAQWRLTLRDVPAVVGFETLNEPHPGWLGTDDLSRPNIGPITTGESPFEQIKRCYGKGPWASECMWAKAGIWLPNENTLQDPGRFHCNWMQQCFAPFVNKFTKAILSEMPHALIGVCPPAFGKESLEAYPETLHPQCFWAPHFYDGIVLLGKVWTPDFGIAETKPGEKLFNLLPAPPVRPVIGLAQRVESYKEQLRQKCDFASQEVPSILGEIGLPFEIQYVGLPGSQPKDSEETLNEAADAHMQALEQIMLPHCWWNYTPENSAERGDLWNGENLSLVSNKEGRAPASLIRPYISRCSGVPVSQSFSFQEGRFRCEFDVQEPGESVLFVPSIQFPSGPKVSVTPGVEVFADFQSQTLLIRNGQYTGRVVVELRKETGAKKRKNDQQASHYQASFRSNKGSHPKGCLQAMQQPPPQSLTGMSSQASRPPVAQVKTQAAPVTVTEADRIAWMRRFLVALELWKKCLDSASEKQET